MSHLSGIRSWTITNVGINGMQVMLRRGSGPVPGESIEVISKGDAEAKAWELDQMAIHAREDLALKDEALAVVVEDRDRQHAEIQRLREAARAVVDAPGMWGGGPQRSAILRLAEELRSK